MIACMPRSISHRTQLSSKHPTLASPHRFFGEKERLEACQRPGPSGLQSVETTLEKADYELLSSAALGVEKMSGFRGLGFRRAHLSGVQGRLRQWIGHMDPWVASRHRPPLPLWRHLDIHHIWRTLQIDNQKFGIDLYSASERKPCSLTQ